MYARVSSRLSQLSEVHTDHLNLQQKTAPNFDCVWSQLAWSMFDDILRLKLWIKLFTVTWYSIYTLK